MSKISDEELKDAEKPNKMGIIGLSSFTIGTIIGAGIFVSVAPTLQATPPSVGFLILFWFFGGTVTLLAGLCYAELGTMIKKSGGERHYLSEAYGNVVAVTYTYVYVFILRSMTFCVLSLATGIYFVEIFMPNCLGTEKIAIMIAVCSQLVAFATNIFSGVFATKVQIFFTVVKISALLAISITGYYHIGITGGSVFKNFYTVEKFSPGALGFVIMSVMFSFEGFNTLSAFVGEVKNVKRTLPISMIISILTITFIYVSTILAYISVLGYQRVMTVQTVAIDFANIMYKKAAIIIPIFICCSAYGTVNSGFFGIPRILMASSFESDVPKIFSLVHKKRRTPVVASLMFLLFTLCFVFLPIFDLIAYCSFLSWFIYFLVFTSLLKFRLKKIYTNHSFQVPLIIPIIVQIVSLFMVVMSFYVAYKGCLVLLAIVTVIFLFVLFIKTREVKSKFASDIHERLCFRLCYYYDLTYCTANDVS